LKREKRSAERLESRGEAFGRLYLASDRYQPVKKNPHRKANAICNQYWHIGKNFANKKDKKTVVYCIGRAII